MQVINTTTNRLHLACFLLMFVSHLCHLVGIFLLTFYFIFLLDIRVSTSQRPNLTQQEHSSSLERKEFRGTITTEEASSTLQHLLGLCLQPWHSHLLWYGTVTAVVVTKKVTCTTLMVLGLRYSSEAERAPLSLVTVNSHFERGCNRASPSLTIYYGSMKTECTPSTHILPRKPLLTDTCS